MAYMRPAARTMDDQEPPWGLGLTVIDDLPEMIGWVKREEVLLYYC